MPLRTAIPNSVMKPTMLAIEITGASNRAPLSPSSAAVLPNRPAPSLA